MPVRKRLIIVHSKMYNAVGIIPYTAFIMLLPEKNKPPTVVTTVCHKMLTAIRFL